MESRRASCLLCKEGEAFLTTHTHPFHTYFLIKGLNQIRLTERRISLGKTEAVPVHLPTFLLQAVTKISASTLEREMDFLNLIQGCNTNQELPV